MKKIKKLLYGKYYNIKLSFMLILHNYYYSFSWMFQNKPFENIQPYIKNVSKMHNIIKYYNSLKYQYYNWTRMWLINE